MERSVPIVGKVLRLTEHAVERCAQRAIRIEHLEFAIEHGRVFQGPECFVVFFGKHEVKRHRWLGSWVEHLDGLTIILQKDAGSVLTAYKNRGGPRRAGRKRDALLADAA
ncbi:MAG: DUF4258 domain-containing protein [Thermomicrobium sp.]|nr:DUF4258 domain-containing protein [Thermomicrobium sp.]MCS7246006.1 DUF4258 domain-containing protein [Thermomicrobium sp.]MDW7981672.1 hypothetical protein [Thermomicrobium sp.]